MRIVNQESNIGNIDLLKDDLGSIDALWNLYQSVSSNADSRSTLCAQLTRLEEKRDGAESCQRLVAGYTALNRLEKVAEYLPEVAEPGDVDTFAMAKLHLSMGRIHDALEALANIQDDGHTPCLEIALAECYRRTGRHDDAAKALDAVEREAASFPGFYCEKGRLCELRGEHDRAYECYRKALEIDPESYEAHFRIGVWYDRWDAQELAIEHLEKCYVDTSTTYTGVLLNLAIIYEDDGNYKQALRLINQYLKHHPTDERAKLYKKDVQGSTVMLYDEAREREEDRHRAILQTPISDFELSVRSRSCLERMNIHTLGDLIEKSEAELLVYKNFGETSLNEIKQMLNQLNLQLGMGRDDEIPPEPTPPQESLNNLDKSVDMLQLTARSFSAIEQMGVTTLGDLADRTEQEILACKGVGRTSLHEIEDALAKFGLHLKVDDDE